MPLNKYACDTVHICSTALLLWSTYRYPHYFAYMSRKKQQSEAGTPHIIAKYVLETIMHSHTTYANYFMCMYETTMSVYISHMILLQLTVQSGALIYIYFTLLACTSVTSHLYIPLH